SLFDQHPGLKQQRDLITSIPGSAEKTAARILAEIPGGSVTTFASARELAAFAGQVPRQWTSGSSVRGRPRPSRMGSARLRKALYLPALVAMTWNPVVRAFCERLAERGKAKKAIVCAAMRKLLHIVFGVLKSRRRFDPNRGLAPS
ncbi:MAG: IS110 family transposase, partial [Candidatus Sericytochromatia bacterium]|nr:IS110 family transposase [Candidatus Tanganyikabacteria bacterium]